MTNFPTNIEHIIVLAFENHDYDTVISQGPYFKQLAQTYSRPTNDKEPCNPSLPNYLASTCGSTKGRCGTDSMSGLPINVPNIFSLVEKAGLKWMGVGEGYPNVDAPRHFPPLFYSNINTANIKSLTDWNALIGSGGTPANFVYVTPNLCHDAHDCGVSTADSWLQHTFNLPSLLTKPWAQNTCFIIWWDEGYGNPRYNVFVSPISKKHDYTNAVTDWDTLATIEWLLGLGNCGQNDANAQIMKSLFSSSGTLSASLNITPNPINVGDQLTLTATVNGGVSPYTYTWNGLPSPCTGANTDIIKCLPTTAGTYNITVTIKDSTTNSTTASGSLTVNKPGALAATLTINPSTITVGQQVIFKLNASGGSPPYKYSWTNLPTPCVGSNIDTITCTPSTAGTYSVNGTVQDSINTVVIAKGSLVVNPTTTKKFSILDVVSDATNIKRGVSAFVNPSGKFTKDQACAEITRILATIPGTKFFVFDVIDDNKTVIGEAVMNNDTNGKFDKQGASAEACKRMANL